ncbi:uncharacterized protein A4U43_C01F15580 [Asparagus officinalis]|uniref:Glutaredoxin domain-containing protein n=1 Tax=Asparagus officinalis TaxID=4686 RepID=A0A5P1FRA9_ASPOF|nr:uncharacterized protein A4U43_C01F15580 [Asparagus officinalis]
MSRIFQSSFLVLFSKQNPAATPKQLLGFISATKSEPQIRPKMPTSMLTRRAPSFYSSSSSFLLRFHSPPLPPETAHFPAEHRTAREPCAVSSAEVDLPRRRGSSVLLAVVLNGGGGGGGEAEAKAPPTRPDLDAEGCGAVPIVEVNPLSKKEIKWSDYQKVPILVVDGQQMIDSSGGLSFFGILCFLIRGIYVDIIEKLSNQIQPAEVVIDEEETKWRRYQLLMFV